MSTAAFAQTHAAQPGPRNACTAADPGSMPACVKREHPHGEHKAPDTQCRAMASTLKPQAPGIQCRAMASTPKPQAPGIQCRARASTPKPKALAHDEEPVKHSAPQYPSDPLMCARSMLACAR